MRVCDELIGAHHCGIQPLRAESLLLKGLALHTLAIFCPHSPLAFAMVLFVLFCRAFSADLLLFPSLSFLRRFMNPSATTQPWSTGDRQHGRQHLLQRLDRPHGRGDTGVKAGWSDA